MGAGTAVVLAVAAVSGVAAPAAPTDALCSPTRVRERFAKGLSGAVENIA